MTQRNNTITEPAGVAEALDGSLPERSLGIFISDSQPHAPLLETSPPAGCVLGFGDILSGDRALGSCVIDALLQEELPENVVLAYCGGDFRGIEAWMHGAAEVHAVLGFSLGGRPGLVRTMDWSGLSAACERSEVLEIFRASMGAALTRLSFIEALPTRTVFHVVETKSESGFGMSREVLQAARETVRRILDRLAGAGVVASRSGQTHRLYRSAVLGRAF